jgi:hypothetical protein
VFSLRHCSVPFLPRLTLNDDELSPQFAPSLSTFKLHGRVNTISSIVLAHGKRCGCFHFLLCTSTLPLDRCLAFLRIYLPSNHVFPLVNDLHLRGTHSSPHLSNRSYSVLGLVPGLVLTIGIAALVLYTSLVLWRFCLAHPHIRDVCDVGQLLFGGRTWAYNITAVFFILNNVFIQGTFYLFSPLFLSLTARIALHVIVGAKYLNTVTHHATCTIVFGVVSAVVCLLISLPRTLAGLAHLGTFSAVTMGIAVLLAIIFAGVQDHPSGYKSGPITVTAFPLEGTTYVQGVLLHVITPIKPELTI